jgi:tetrahydromethanopterin S-methyltransferase subunit G
MEEFSEKSLEWYGKWDRVIVDVDETERDILYKRLDKIAGRMEKYERQELRERAGQQTVRNRGIVVDDF